MHITAALLAALASLTACNHPPTPQPFPDRVESTSNSLPAPDNTDASSLEIVSIDDLAARIPLPDPDGREHNNFARLIDNLDAIDIQVPAEWSDIDGMPQLDDGGTPTAALFWASSDLDAFRAMETAGVFVYAAHTSLDLTLPETLLNTQVQGMESVCETRERFRVANARAQVLDVYTGCHAAKATYLAMALLGSDTGYLVMVENVVFTPADLEAVLTGWETLEVDLQALPGERPS